MATGRVYEAIPMDKEATEDDIEGAFDEWKKGLDDSESPGNIRAFRVPLDESGKPSYSSTGQVRLGTWPIDQYDFDTLCTKLLKEFMLPTEHLMAVRLIGTVKGKPGLGFNRIVTLQRPNNTTPVLTGPTGDPITGIMKQMAESNERMMRMFQEMGGSKPGGGDQNEMMRFAAMMRVMMEPMTSMMGPMLTALAGRPLPATVATTGGSLKETVETMALLDRMFAGRRGGGSSAPSEPDWVKVIQSVSGVAKPLLELAAANRVTPTRTRPPTTITQSPTAVPTPAPVAAPSPVVPPATPGVDLSRPSTAPVSALAPGPNIEAPSTALPGDANMFAEMKKQVDALVQIAQSGVDASAVADEFFQTTMLPLTEEDYGRLAAVVESDGFLNSVRIYNAQVGQLEPWFTAFRDRLVARIVAEDTVQ